MSVTPLRFTGFIKSVTYAPFLTPREISGQDPETYVLRDFDINAARPSGLIRYAPNALVGYSKWVSPKRTRSYPFERIYNTLNAPKILTVIPILKDEGADGDLDKIGYTTFSWMNLLNVYIVLAFYESGVKSTKPQQRDRHKITRQRFNQEFVRQQIAAIIK